MQVGDYAAHHVGGGLETQLRTVVGRGLALEYADQVHRAHPAQRIARCEAHDRRGSNREQVLLLEAGPDAAPSRTEQGLGVAERQQPREVVDAVVHTPDQQAVVHLDLFAPLLDLDRAEVQPRAVGPRRRRVLQPELEARGWPL